MTDDELRENLEDFLEPLLADADVELVDLIIKHQNKSMSIEVLADKAHGGITLDECTYINRQLSAQLEEEDIIAGHYTISVSSPGLDRPLKTVGDFNRVMGRNVKFHLSEKIEQKVEHDGIIKAVNETAVTIEAKSNEIVIPLNIINKAIQII